MGLRKKIISMIDVYQEQGGRVLLRKIFDKFIEKTVFVAMQRDLNIARPLVKCNIPFELKKLDDATISEFRKLPPPFPRHYQYRFEYGLRNCYGAFHKDKIVALMWPFCRKDNSHMVTKWRFLLADEARVSNLWVDPAYRGTGLMLVCMAIFANYFKNAGCNYQYGFTWENNHASIKFHSKSGFHIAGKILRYSFPFLKEGNGIYFRSKIIRNPVPPECMEDDFNLPERVVHTGIQEET